MIEDIVIKSDADVRQDQWPEYCPKLPARPPKEPEAVESDGEPTPRNRRSTMMQTCFGDATSSYIRYIDAYVIKRIVYSV